MVKGEGGGARCCAGSERETTRRVCKHFEGAGQAAAQSEGGGNIYALLDRNFYHHYPGNSSPASNKTENLGMIRG